MSSRKSNRVIKNTRTAVKLSDVLFAESVIGLAIIVNPKFESNDELWNNINWQSPNNDSTVIKHKKDKQYVFASIVFTANDPDDYWCATTFIDDPFIYDISPDIIMNKNEWYRRGLLRFTTKNATVERYVNDWMSGKCAQIIKYKKRRKRMKRKVSFTMIEVQKLMAQYGIFLGYNMYGTLNAIGLKQQQTKMVKMPLSLFLKTTLFQRFISKKSLYYIKNKKHIFNVNKYKDMTEWLNPDYVIRKEENGLWSYIQCQIIYNPPTQMLMLKYDVFQKDNAGNIHYNFRDINKDNPNFLDYQKIQKLVFGYVRLFAETVVPIVLVQLCLEFRYLEDE
eukprot:284480_1